MGRVRVLFDYRQLVWTLASQALRVKYRRSALGFLWSLLNPLLMLVVVATVFQFLVRLGIQSYALFLLSSLVPWLYFSSTTSACAASLLQAEGLLRRQPIPKLVFPLSACLVHLFHFALSLGALLLIVAPFIGFRPGWEVAILPLGLACLLAFTIGVGAAIATLTVYFRDVEHLFGVALMAWMYATPILYPLYLPGQEPLIPESYHWLFELNPMYHVIQLFTRPIYWGEMPDLSAITAAMAFSASALVGGAALLWWREDDLLLRL